MSIERISDSWEYDGTFLGFLTIVHRAFSKKQFPAVILTPETAVESLFFSEQIETDTKLAEKIFARLDQRLRKDNFQFIQDGFNSSLTEKEVCLLDALEIALQSRDSLANFIGHPSILALQKSIKSLYGEAHLFTGFVRFEFVGELLFSKIRPKHFSLPYICPHFAERYPLQTMLIYDETHRLLAIIENSKVSLLQDVDCPEFDMNVGEDKIQKQWLTFLEAVTIKERINPRVQMSHLPLRFRGNMVDFQSKEPNRQRI